jgi:cytochrome P450
VVVRSLVIVTKYSDVREVLDRFNDFNLSDMLGPKMPWGPLLLSLDWREQHDRERQLLQSIVFQTDADAIKTKAAAKCRDLIAAKQAAGEINVVSDLCDIVTVGVINEYIGIPIIGDIRVMTAILGDVAGFILVDPPALSARYQRAYASMATLTKRVLDQIKSQGQAFGTAPSPPAPTDDLLTRLVKLRCGGRGPAWFDDDWIRRYITGLAATGGGTIVRATTQAIDQLIAHPAGLQEAQALAAKLQARYDPAVWNQLRQLVYEGLRFRPMLPLLGRYSPRETIIAKGTSRARTVPAGATVLAPPIAGMFDPKRFEDPSRFSSRRPLDSYLHFGVGPRECFGRYVADVVIMEIIYSLLHLPNLRRAAGSKGRIQYDGPVATSLCLQI